MVAKNARLQWLDFLKGIAILLVIVSHTLPYKIVVALVFSFHMPLFFAITLKLSGYQLQYMSG